jgi:hypothetical protein
MGKQFRMTVDMDNAAFEDGEEGGHELRRLLELAAFDVFNDATPYHAHPVMDFNGNRVGQWEITGEDD